MLLLLMVLDIAGFFMLLRMLLLMTLRIPFDTGVTDFVKDVVQVVLVKLILV